MPIPADQIDPEARKVVRRLVGHKHQAYLVGGCVRDLLLERKPKDFDIATSATPNEVKALFRNCRIIGRRFRLAHIFFGSKIIETATFRANPREVDGGDGEDLEAGEGAPDRASAATGTEDLLIRRDNVFGNAEEDARRRDFTINGLFYDIEVDQVIDYVGGLADLAARSVRTIGDPDIRFREDPIRILRAIKFASRLDFNVEPATYQAILTHKLEISKCAAPRILEEIYRLLRGGAAVRSFELLRDTGVLDVLVPELSSLLGERAESQEARWFWEIATRIDADRDRAPSNAVLLCALMAPFLGPPVFDDSEGKDKVRDIGAYIEDQTRQLLEELRVSRRDAERARQILLAQRRIAPSKKRRGRAMTVVRRDWFEEALQVFERVGQVVRPDPLGPEEISRWRKLQHQEDATAGMAPRGEGQGSGSSDDGGTTAIASEPVGENGAMAVHRAAGAGSEAATNGAAGGQKKRRRRRRGGRRRRGEVGSDAAATGDLELDGDGESDGDEVATRGSSDDPAAMGDAVDQVIGVALEPIGEAMEPAQASAAPPSTGSSTPVR